MGESVKEANDDEQQGVRYHYGLISYAVDQFAHPRREEETGNGRYGK